MRQCSQWPLLRVMKPAQWLCAKALVHWRFFIAPERVINLHTFTEVALSSHNKHGPINMQMPGLDTASRPQGILFGIQSGERSMDAEQHPLSL